MKTSYHIHQKRALFSAILLLLLGACQQDVDKFDPIGHEAPGDLESVFEAIQNLNRTYTLNLYDEVIHLKVGKAHLSIAPNAFVNSVEDIVQGEIKLQVTELTGPTDMIKYDWPSSDENGQLLEMKWAINIEASQQGESLTLNTQSSEGIIVRVTDDQSSEYTLYGVSEFNSSNTWTEEGVQVANGEITIIEQGYEKDTTGFEFQLPVLDWVSLQHDVSAQDYTQICLDLLDSNTPENTRAFFLFDNRNSCQRIEISSGLNCVWTPIPVEFEGTLVVLANKGGDIFEAGSRRIVITSNIGEVELLPVGLDSGAELLFFVEGL